MQGCSVLEDAGIFKHHIKGHTVFKKLKADIFNIIFAHAKHVEGSTTDSVFWDAYQKGYLFSR